MKAADPTIALVEPHDHPHVIAGHGTCALETIKQVGQALEGGEGSEQLDAIFVVAGGSSLLAGISAVMKSVMPNTKVCTATAPAPATARPRRAAAYTRLPKRLRAPSTHAAARRAARCPGAAR